MTKVQIKSEKLTPFGGIFAITEQFNALLSRNSHEVNGYAPEYVGGKYCKNFNAPSNHHGYPWLLDEFEAVLREPLESLLPRITQPPEAM